MKNQLLNTCFFGAITIVVACPVHAQQSASVEPVPNLTALSTKPSGDNQCYARVSVPAEYKTEIIETELVPELERFNVTPPVFKDGSETITIAPATTKITAVQPVLEEKTHEFEVMPSSRLWVRDSVKGEQPLTSGELADLNELGIDTDSVAVGTCYFEHFVEATLQDIPTEVMISEASETLSVSDAVIKDEVVSVTVTPAYTHVVEVPASLKKGEERVLTAFASKQWKTECGAVQQVDHMTGETLCLVDVPATFETVETETIDVPTLLTNVEKEAITKELEVKTLVSGPLKKRKVIQAAFDSIDRQKVLKPARYSWLTKSERPAFGFKPTGRGACFVEIPAKIVEYKRQEVKTPGRFDVENIPAQTTTVDVSELVSEAVVTEYNEPAKTIKIERQIVVTESKLEWKPVLCEVNFSEDIVVQLQKALSKEGYEPGPIDGIMGRGTTDAIRKYQIDNKLADGGLTIETLQKLGIDQ